MEHVEIKKNVRALQLSIFAKGMVVFAIALLATLLLLYLLSWTTRTENTIIWIVWLLLVGLWLVQSLLELIDWKERKYEIDAESIRITKPIGLLRTTIVVYRYESIISVKMSQGFWAKRFGYGSVYFSIPKLEKEEALRGIDHPEVQLQRIQSKLQKKGADTQVLIS